MTTEQIGWARMGRTRAAMSKIAGLAASLASTVSVVGQTYRIIEIPPVQNDPAPAAYAINAAGIVVGVSSESSIGGNFWGFVYQQGIGSSQIAPGIIAPSRLG